MAHLGWVQDLPYRIHFLYQILVCCHFVGLHVCCGHFVEQLFCTVNLGLFYGRQIHGRHRTLRLCYKEDMLHLVTLHCYCPVGSVVAYWCRDLERTGKFGINHNLIGLIQILGKLAFSLAVAEHIICHMLRNFSIVHISQSHQTHLHHNSHFELQELLKAI